MEKPIIAFLDNLKIMEEHITQLQHFGSVIQSPSDWPKQDEVLQLVSNATIIVSKWVYISETILANAPHLQYVVMAMTGYQDWVDMEAIKKRKLLVSNVPAFSTEAVAEHALLLMLTVARRLPHASKQIQSGIFNPKEKSLQGFELKGKTLGIIGRGHIGSRIEELAKVCGMNVFSINSTSSKEEFHKLLRKSEIISVNTPLTPKTFHLLSEKELSLTQKGTVIINTSRGKVISEKALIKYLQNGHLAGAGLDVFEKEPLPAGNPLLKMSNVVATPHIAYNTRESYKRLCDGVVENIKAFIAEKPKNVVS
ncbi:3-phosphoglycerate dehydrogenase [Candidatus Gottesmanbacteria bacterium]|nr:3-phosphoglycerate dehydrogenase [Candidatus Gottesmanbacteria bacterium]